MFIVQWYITIPKYLSRIFLLMLLYFYHLEGFCSAHISGSRKTSVICQILVVLLSDSAWRRRSNGEKMITAAISIRLCGLACNFQAIKRRKEWAIVHQLVMNQFGCVVGTVQVLKSHQGNKMENQYQNQMESLPDTDLANVASRLYQIEMDNLWQDKAQLGVGRQDVRPSLDNKYKSNMRLQTLWYSFSKLGGKDDYVPPYTGSGTLRADQ